MNGDGDDDDNGDGDDDDDYDDDDDDGDVEYDDDDEGDDNLALSTRSVCVEILMYNVSLTHSCLYYIYIMPVI